MRADRILSAPEYSGFISRLLLKPLFENQWVIPEPLPGWYARFLEWYERNRMRVDLDGIGIDRPVFILSLPRCGSSMLQDILCTHPGFGFITNTMDAARRSSVCAAEHLRARLGLNVRGERFLGDSVAVDGGSPADPVATWSDLLGLDYFDVADRIPEAGDLNGETVAAVRRRIREVLWCFGRPVHRFFCKTPMLLPYARVLREIFPDARFIHLLRDPRQCANSMVKLHRLCNEQLLRIRRRRRGELPEGEFVPYPRLPGLSRHLAEFGAGDVRTTARLWNDAIDFIDSVRGSLGHFHEVRYEDILDDPEGRIAELFRFCELNPPGAEHRAYRDKLAGIGVVHHRNDYGQFDVIEEICGRAMRRYGYLE